MNTDEAHRRAEALFKKEQQSHEAQQAMTEYEAELQASPRRHELAAISFVQKMIRRRQSQQHPCSVCAGLSAQRERVW